MTKLNNKIIIYQAPGGSVSLEVKLEGETIWLSLNQMAQLFDRDKSVISRHLRNVFKKKELKRNSVVAFFATTAADGKTYKVEYFNLDAILSVGYRVNSKRGTQFRIWATRQQANCRQCPGGYDPADCRKPPAGKRPPNPRSRASYSPGGDMNTKSNSAFRICSWPPLALAPCALSRLP